MGRRKAPATRRKQVLKLGEQNSSTQGPTIDPYRQTITSTQPTKSFVETPSPSEGENNEASTKLKNLLDEIDQLGSRNSVEEEEPMNTEQATPAEDAAKSDPLKVGDYSSDTEARETAEEGLTFWKQVTDPNTNHAYYWNPRTNQVSWTLPNNGVIADDNPPQEDSNGEADNPYAEYYAYYKQHYEATQAAEKENESKAEDSAKTESDKATVNKEERPQSKEITQADQSTVKTTTKPTKTQLKKAKKAKKAGTESEQEASVTFVGPVLPASHTLAAKPQDEPVTDAGRTSGLKRKVSTEEQVEEPVSENGLDPAAKKPRLKTKAVSSSPGGAKKTASPQTPLSMHAEQAIRFQVSNMADELTRKLDYLHVTNEGLSDIQVLNIQLQTRLSDWKEGGLNSKFMLSKLKTSAVALQDYEQLAAPEGWKIVWDSSSCRYQYHNLSTGETTWQYPLQPTESSETSSQEEAENSSMEESSDNEAPPSAPEVPVPSAPTSKAVIGPQLPTAKVVSSNPPPPPPPSEMRLTPVTTSKVAPDNQPPPTRVPVTTSKVVPGNQPPLTHVPVTTSKVTPSNQPPAPPSSEVPNNPPTGPQRPQVPAKPSIPEPPQYEPPKEPFVYKSYKARHREPPPPPPPPRFDLTVDQLREKLYPSLKPKRQRVRPEEPEVLVPVVPTVEAIEESPVPPAVVNREGMEFISEFPITKPEKEQNTQPKETKAKTDTTNTAPSAPPTATMKVTTVTSKVKTSISESSKPIVPIQISEATKARTAEIPHSVGADPSVDSEARLRERLLERQRQKGLVKLTETSDKEPAQMDVSSQATSQAKVEQATGEHLGNRSVDDSQTTSSKQDDSRVEPETGEVESNAECFTQRKASTDLYQDWTPSPTEGSPQPIGDLPKQEPSPAKPADESIDDGEVSRESESSSSSESESEGEGRDKAAPMGKCYMDKEEKRAESRKTERHSDDERKRRRSSRRSHKDYSSDESEERQKRKERHRRSLRHEDRDSDDERSRKRSSRSSRRSSKKNRSRSRSSRRHRRSRSHSKDSQSSHRSDSRGKKKSPKHKKVKKEKKKKHHRTEKEQKADKDKKEDAPKPPPNVIVGKVGRFSSKRTLGKDKKPEQDTPKTPVGTSQAAQQTMSATYYQQPSTGQVPYYDYYSQGYYDPNAYQQWQGHWYGTGQDATAASQYGTVQYPISGGYTAATGSAQYTTATQSSTQYTAPSTSQETTSYAQDTVVSSTAPSTAVAPEQVQDTIATPQHTTATSQDTSMTSEVTQYMESAPAKTQDSISSQETVNASQEALNTAYATNSQPANTVNELASTIQSTQSLEYASQLESTGEKQAVEESAAQVEVSSPVKPPAPPPEEESVVTEEPMLVLEQPSQGVAEIEVETEDQIEECDMDIDDNSPTDSPQPPPEQEPMQPTISSTLSATQDMSIGATPSQEMPMQTDTQSSQPASMSVAEDSEMVVTESQPSQEEPPTVPPPPEDTNETPSEEKSEPPSLTESTETPTCNKPADDGTKLSEPQQPETPAKTEANAVPPPASTPPTPPAVGPPTTATSTYDYSTYMLAAQQQQAYNYAYATNNYMQAAYNAYVQQASAAAYQAYGSPYYPGYGTPYVAAGGFSGGAYSTASSYYGSTASPVTQTSTGGGYGKVAYQLAQQAANAATTESSDTKKSEFAIAGSKSKQMKSMMDKWSSFKDDKEDSPSS